ncbi:MAG: hypothetical protein OXI05_12650 [Bacteroidota bacterium]|nr:hypothetical protein [Bacteroidota bacterium]
MPRTRRVSTRKLRKMDVERLQDNIGGEGVKLAEKELDRRERRRTAMWSRIWAALVVAVATAVLSALLALLIDL